MTAVQLIAARGAARPRKAGAALLASLALLALTASGAQAGSGTYSASCNYNAEEMLWAGPHVQIDSANLWPTGNRSGQWVATKEFVYQYGTNVEVESPAGPRWNMYWATRDGKIFEGPAPDFHLGPGWWKARIVAYAWDPATGWTNTLNTWVQYDNGSWWCAGR